MSFAPQFYNELTKKYIAAFGILFQDITIERTNPTSGTQRIIVPITYSPVQKFISRLTQSPDLENNEAIVYPRMAFEITGFTYDGSRKLNTMKRIRRGEEESFRYAPVPYNIEITMYVAVKYSEDGYKILEQILPFFTPDYTLTLRLLPGYESIDVPILLNGSSVDNAYEGSFEDRQTILMTLNFTMYAHYFGPDKQRKLIKFVDGDIMKPNSSVDTRVIDKNDPTKNWWDVDLGDDWGSVTVIEEGESG